jgi:hypothetical protein
MHGENEAQRLCDQHINKFICGCTYTKDGERNTYCWPLHLPTQRFSMVFPSVFVWFSSDIPCSAFSILLTFHLPVLFLHGIIKIFLKSCSSVIVWTWFECPTRLPVLKLNLHCERLRKWKLNFTMVFGGGAFGRLLRLDKVIREELPWLNLSFIRRSETRRASPYSFFLPSLFLTCVCSVSSWSRLCQKETTDKAPQPCTSRTVNQNKLILFIE